MTLPNLAIFLVSGYAFLLAGCTLLQRQLLYFPEPLATPAAPPGMHIWPASGEFRGYLAEPSSPAAGTAVVFHGNAGHAGQRGYYAAALGRFGFRVILAEYPGYGPRPGEIREESLVVDARDTLLRASQQFGSPLLAVGESLGAGVVAAAAGPRQDLVSGLLLITPWKRLEDAAGFHYPWLPVHWLLWDHYDSGSHLAGFSRPVLIAVAENDQVVPIRFGSALYESLSAPKRLSIIPGADHNDWPGQVDEGWWQEAVAFLLETGARTTVH